jgi:Co/Zn/Cd efflux system component
MDTLIADCSSPPPVVHDADPLHSDEVAIAPMDNKQNVNLRSAYLHVMADLAQSTAVLITGVVIWF